MIKRYDIIKAIVGVAALGMSLEYFLAMTTWPEYISWYMFDLVAWFLFSCFMVGEAFISLTEDARVEP